MQSLASMTATFVQHSWFGHQQHVREDAACKSPHPTPMLSDQHVSVAQQTKRKRIDNAGTTVNGSSISFAESQIAKRPKNVANSTSPVKARPAPVSQSTTIPPADTRTTASSTSSTTGVISGPSTVTTHHSSSTTDSLVKKFVPPQNITFQTDDATSEPELAADAVMTTSDTSSISPEASIASDSTIEASIKDDKPVECAASDDATVEIKAKNRVHDRISLFLNTNILLKHKELRLIEAEMAKCQIALEQLRRCHILPFPGNSSSDSNSAKDIISGTGPALENASGLDTPPFPSPFAVTDGPYTRHYARWLLPDPLFDASPARTSRTATGTQPIALGRKARGNEDAHMQSSITVSTLSSSTSAPPSISTIPSIPKLKRATTCMFLQLPTYAHMFRDGKNRLVVRNNDGEWVKIVCRQCGKADSANLQGFTNHTRIAHQMPYTKHDDAVKECGQPLNVEESALVNASAQTISAAGANQTATVMSTAESRTHSVSVQTMSQQQIHPQPKSRSLSIVTTPTILAQNINSGKPFMSSMLQGPSRQSASAKKFQERLKTVDRRSANGAFQTPKIGSPSSPNPDFVGAASTPGLNSLLLKRGSSINLQRIVTDARCKIDLDQVTPAFEAEEDDSLAGSPAIPARSSALMNRKGASQPLVMGHDTPMDYTPVTSPRPMDQSEPQSSVAPPESLSTSTTSSTSTDDESSFARRDSKISFTTARYSQSPRISPRGFDNDPGMITDHGDDDDVDAHLSEHGGDDNASLMHRRHQAPMVRVRGDDTEHYRDEEDLHAMAGIDQRDSCNNLIAPPSHPSTTTSTTSVPNAQALPRNSGGFFSGFQSETGVPVIEKKRKRGRPKKNP